MRSYISPSSERYKNLVWYRNREIRHAFEAIDTDASGHLSVTEFKEALNRLGMGLTNHQLNSISSAFDIKEDTY